MNIDAPVQTTTEPVEEIVVPDVEHQLDTSFDQIGSNRLQHILEMDLPRPKALLSHHGYDVGQRAVAGGAVAVVVVVCVGFLLVLLVIGVLKMRDTPIPRRRRRRNPSIQEGAMEWDDSGMNITVNPLEDVEKNPNEFSGEEDSSDGGESYRDEEGLTDDEEDEGEQVLPHIQNGARQNSTGLEWDDTTLTNVSRTYRV